MEREYYIVEFIIENTCCFMIWYTDDTDGFVTENGNITIFSSFDSLTEFANDMEINLQLKITEYNVDILAEKIKVGFVFDKADCNFIINFWNIFSDLAHSLNESFSGDDTKYNDIYGRLVYGCDLPSLNDDNCRPTFSDLDKEIICNIFVDGIELLKSIIRS